MNIYATKGRKVKVTEQSSKNGWDNDVEKVAQHLELNKEYTVDFTLVHRSKTDVCLEEFPDLYFNSVNFEDVDEIDEEKECQHPQYYYI